MATDDKRRIEKLENALKQRDRRIEELKNEIDEQHDLIQRMEEHADDYVNCLESWKEVFEMEQTEDGAWTWKPFWDEWGKDKVELSMNCNVYNLLVDQHNDLVRRWNEKLRGGNPVGRPLAASEAQITTVLELRERGTSLRDIAEETSLGLNTVRTIISKENGTDRTTRRYRRLRGLEGPEERQERDPEARQRVIRFKRQKRTGDALPKRAQRVVEEGRALITEAKGLGRKPVGG